MNSIEPKKLALIRIWRILKEHSDDRHPMTQEDIARRLDIDYGLTIERKAIGRNISLLKEAGVEIESTRNGCYLSVREFEDAELRLLIDAVLGSRHIVSRQSADLIDRLCKLSNRHFRSHVRYIHSVGEWGKTENQSLFLNIALINDAIEQKVRIKYSYNKYGIDKKLHKTSTQAVTPFLLILHNQRYYLMAYSEYWSSMVYHRLDRITDMQLLEDKATPLSEISGYEHGIDYKRFSASLPYMFPDKPERITFLAERGIIDQIIDWFGTDFRITPCEDDETKVIIDLNASISAMEYWALQYLNYVEILSPDTLREQIRASIEKGMEKYTHST